MTGLMHDARLRVSEAAVLTWADVDESGDASRRVFVGSGRDPDYRVVSVGTMKLLSTVRRGAGNDALVLGMRPNQIARRIGSAARHAGFEGRYAGDSLRLGMIWDMETFGALLLGSHIAKSAR